ncbi:MAG: hypothetical protein ACRC3Y_00715 [Romboutsia sp.]|uniref:hypothetical protein n=1 Tax=Romboutsia sp. TaxID=1965302 RepID=UPI003F3FFCE1
MNIVFTGNVGTGKKTILNILAEMYFSRGIIKSKGIVEIDKRYLSSMINDGIQIEDILNKFIGKLVLIDKADLLVEEYNYDELISSLIKFIDKNKNKIIIVLCGDREKMKKLILSNQSLNYRFPIWLKFDDYNRDELFDITINLLKDKGFTVPESGLICLKETISEFYKIKNLSVANAIMIRKYLDKLVREQSIRVYNEKLAPKEMNIINNEDIINSKNKFLEENILESDRVKDNYKEISKENNYDKNLNISKYYKVNILDEILKLKSLLDLKLINEEEFEILKLDLIHK